jgi:hypothetical protein
LVGFQYRFRLFFWLGLVCSVGLVTIDLLLHARLQGISRKDWLDHNMQWLMEDRLFVILLVGGLSAVGSVMGAFEGDVLRGAAYGFVFGLAMTGVHYAFHGNWKRRVFG